MEMNPALKKLGFNAQDRVVIIHADDIGMCQATLPAFADLFDFGLVSSAATMVPCSWFPAVAAFCRNHPDVDMGVHLTLNCEWKQYRWGPLSTHDPAFGLLDDQGYFHASPAMTLQNAGEAAVANEMQAQVDRALQAGIDATHVDAHMLTASLTKYLPSYRDVAQQHQLPAFHFKNIRNMLLRNGFDTQLVEQHERLLQEMEERGIPLFDNINMLPLDNSSNRVAVAKQIIDNLPGGLSVLILHPAQDTPELRAIAPDWACRVADYEAFRSSELRDHIRQSGVQVIGYRPLRELLRA